MTSLQTIARKLDGDGAEVTWRDVTLRGSSFQTCKSSAADSRQPRSDLARKPHARCTQQYRGPAKVISTTTDNVDSAVAASIVPESSAVEHCAVIVVLAVGPRIVVSVFCGEHHSVMVSECITGVARVARHLKRVVSWLPKNSKPAVLCPVPADVT